MKQNVNLTRREREVTPNHGDSEEGNNEIEISQREKSSSSSQYYSVDNNDDDEEERKHHHIHTVDK